MSDAPTKTADGGCSCGYATGSRPTQIGCGNSQCPFGVQEVNTQLKPVARMSDDEIADVVRGLVAGSIFTAAQCPPEMLTSVFMVLGLGGLGQNDPETVGMIYEYMDKANPMAINGFPTFFSCKLIHKEDWAIIAERAIAAQEALDRAALGGK